MSGSAVAPERDSQRARVYAAEAQVARLIDVRLDYPTVQLFGSEVVVPDDRKFGDLESVQRYVDAVVGLNWVTKQWPIATRLPVKVRARVGATRAHYERETATIAIPSFEVGGGWALRELVVLHELAHHLTAAEVSMHGPQFVTNLLLLVSELLGPEAEFLLRTTYLENQVRMD
jgi:putative metallohydrolase (TIGR04338 family)